MKAILVNIFGGIVRCDMIARAIIHALNEARITRLSWCVSPVITLPKGSGYWQKVALTVELSPLDDAAKRIIALPELTGG